MIWRLRTPTTWTLAVVWSAIGAFDALAAFIVETSSPWPDFFMLELFGRAMFFAAIGLHMMIVVLLAQPEVTADFGISRDRTSGGASAVVTT